MDPKELSNLFGPESRTFNLASFLGTSKEELNFLFDRLLELEHLEEFEFGLSAENEEDFVPKLTDISAEIKSFFERKKQLKTLTINLINPSLLTEGEILQKLSVEELVLNYSERSDFAPFCDVILGNHSIKKLCLVFESGWDEEPKKGASDFPIEKLLKNTQSLEEFEYRTRNMQRNSLDQIAKGLAVNKTLKNLKFTFEVEERYFGRLYKQIEQIFVAVEKLKTLELLSFEDVTSFVPDDPDPLDKIEFPHFKHVFEKITPKTLILQIHPRVQQLALEGLLKNNTIQSFELLSVTYEEGFNVSEQVAELLSTNKTIKNFKYRVGFDYPCFWESMVAVFEASANAGRLETLFIENDRTLDGPEPSCDDELASEIGKHIQNNLSLKKLSVWAADNDLLLEFLPPNVAEFNNEPGFKLPPLAPDLIANYFEQIPKHPNLKKFKLLVYEIESAQEVFKQLENAPKNFPYVNFTIMEISSSDFKHIAKALATNENIKEFGLIYDYDITEREWTTVLEALAKNKGIEKIWLHSNWVLQFGEEEQGEKLKQILSKNTTLCEVGFYDTDQLAGIAYTNLLTILKRNARNKPAAR